MSEKQSSKRRPRITNYQKTNLVSLVQNFFIRSVGHHSNVNFDEINSANWERIASILNTMGPVKTGAQWRSTLYYMKNRIRKTVKQILQCGASPYDNLSTLDVKIYEMILTDDLGVTGTSDNYANEGELGSEYQHEQDSQDAVDDGVGTIGGFHSESLNGKDEEYSDVVTAYDDYSNFEVASKNEVEPEVVNVPQIGTVLEQECSVDATVVINTLDELDAYDDSTMIEEDATNDHQQNDVHSECDFPVDASAESLTEHPPSTHRPFSTPSVNRKPSTSILKFTHRTQSITRPASNDSPPSVDQAPFIARPSVGRSPLVQNKSTPKTNVRIPEIQKERLVQLVQNNFFKAMGRFAGSHGKGIKTQLWQSIAKELNTLGPQRSAEQWKTTFDAIKSSAKAKLADAHNGSVGKPLTRLEEKIVSIYGMDSLDGQQTLGESGFHYKKTIPATVTRQDATEASNMEIETDVQATTTTTDEIEQSVLEDILREIRDEPNAEMAPLNELDVTILTSNVNRSNAPLQSGTSHQSPATLQSDPVERSVLEEILREIRDESNADTDEMTPLNELDVAILTSNINRSNVSLRQSGTSQPSNPVTGRQSVPGTSRQSALATAATRPSHLSTARQSGPGAERQISAGAGRQSGAGLGTQNRFGLGRQLSFGSGHQFGSGSGRQFGTGSSSGRHTAAGGNSANSHTGRPNSARRMFAPPIRARRNRRESECEYITNINQFFDDGTDEEEDNHRSTPNENRDSGNTRRDRSNLRNNQTSFQMVQGSITSQERFIGDANRNHSEMMHLIDRNHVETVGMFNSLLSGVFDLRREYLNRH